MSVIELGTVVGPLVGCVRHILPTLLGPPGFLPDLRNYPPDMLAAFRGQFGQFNPGLRSAQDFSGGREVALVSCCAATQDRQQSKCSQRTCQP